MTEPTLPDAERHEQERLARVVKRQAENDVDHKEQNHIIMLSSKVNSNAHAALVAANENVTLMAELSQIIEKRYLAYRADPKLNLKIQTTTRDSVRNSYKKAIFGANTNQMVCNAILAMQNPVSATFIK